MLIVLNDISNILETNLVVIMTSNKHVGNILYVIELIVHSHTHTLVTIVPIASITCLVLVVESGKNLRREHTKVSHTVFAQLDFDTLATSTVYLDSAHTVNGNNLTFQEFGIIGELAVAKTVAHKGIEHTIDITEVIPNHRYGSTSRQLCLHVAHLTTQQVPLLFHGIISHSRLKLDSNE